jgi:hypothetical protein
VPKPTLAESLRQFFVPLLPAILGSLASAVNCKREDFSWWRLVRKVVMGLFVGKLMLCLANMQGVSDDVGYLATALAGTFADEFLLLIKGKVQALLK